MALVHALLGQWMPTLGASLGRRKVGKVILHGQSRRAYAFEVHHAQAGDGLSDVPAVYIYARNQGLAAASGSGFSIGFIGRTENMGQRAGEHERLGHFAGHAFDSLLLLRVEHEPIRIDIERDLIEHHRPALNELLRGYQGNVLS